MDIYRRIVPILFIILIYPKCVFAGDLTPGRVFRPTDTVLRDQLATAHFVRGEPVEILAIYPPIEKASSKDHFNVGTALSQTGRFILASEAFHRAVSKSVSGSETHLEAILQFLKMSPYNPDLELPPVDKGMIIEKDPELSLALSGYIADRGDREGAYTILEKTSFLNTENKVISGILSAGHLAAGKNWSASAKILGKIKNDGSSTLTDLFYLTRGYHYLQSGQPQRAKSSFLAVPPSSPYASEVLLGKAWSLIRADDLQGAAIVLEELIDRHRYSPAAGEGVLDLAIAYRELGLYDRASMILDEHLNRLQEVRNWLLELRDTDVRPGSDIIVLLEGIIEGSRVDSNVLVRTPAFVRQWVKDAAAEPIVIQTTALLKGAGLIGEKSARLNERLSLDRSLVRKEIDWVNYDISQADATMTRLEEMRNELNSIKNDMSSILQSLSLNKFASEKALELIKRSVELKLRLSFMENSVRKAEGFTNLVDRLSESVTATQEESQLNKIRKQAYEGLVSSRLTLRRYRHSLSALEGQLWLEVKGSAIDLERKTSLRVTSGRSRAGQASADMAKVVRMLNDQLKALENLENLLLTGTEFLGTTLQIKLDTLKRKIADKRSARILALASQAAREIKDAEALTLYTSADIEIARMENIVHSLQEAVE